MLGDVAIHGARETVEVPGAAMIALFGGGAIYLVSLSALRWRLSGKPSITRTM